MSSLKKPAAVQGTRGKQQEADIPRNGNGVYTLPSNSWNPAVTGTTIESSANNATMNDLASAMTQSVSKDGQTIMTGNLPMGNNKLTGLADGSSATDSMAYGQGAKLSGGNIFTGDQTINGSVSLSGSLTVTGPVIFSSGSISVESLNVSSVASINKLNVASVASLNILNVASVASINALTAVTAAIAVLSVASINAVSYRQNNILLQPIAQVVNFQTGSVATGSTQIPGDDTIPQNTEGDQYLSLSITPKSATNTLDIISVLNASPAIATFVTAALFQDSTASALAAGAQHTPAQFLGQITLRYRMTAGTTSPTTFKIRAGPSGATTLTVNGTVGARLLGGVLFSSITITEYVT